METKTSDQVITMSKDKLDTAENRIDYLKTYLSATKTAWICIKRKFYEVDIEAKFEGLLLIDGVNQLWYNIKDSELYVTEKNNYLKHPIKKNWHAIVSMPEYDVEKAVSNLITAVVALSSKRLTVDPELVKSLQIVSASKVA